MFTYTMTADEMAMWEDEAKRKAIWSYARAMIDAATDTHADIRFVAPNGSVVHVEDT